MLLCGWIVIGCAGAPAAPPPLVAKAEPARSPPADSAPTVLTATQSARDAALADRVAQVIDAFTNTAPRLLRDGRVVFVSNRGGIPALYLGDARQPGAAPRKLPVPDERVAGVRVLPDERAVLFVSDVKADGNFAIFRVDIDGLDGLDGRDGRDGGAARNLTPGETLHRDAPFVGARAGGLMVYSAHSMTDRTARVFIQGTDGAPAAREIYTDPMSGSVADMAPDGKHVLYSRFRSENEREIFELDADTGAASRIYPPDGARLLVPVAKYSADGRRILVGVVQEGRPGAVIAIDRRTGKPTARYEETALATALIDDIEVSPAGDVIAITIDAGNRSAIRLLDARTLKARRTVDTGLSAGSTGPFRADGKAFGMVQSRPDAPNDIYSVDPRTAKVTPLRHDARPGLAGSPRVEASIVEVRAHDGLALPVNLYRPVSSTERRPTIVLVHGGPSGSAYVRFSAEVSVLVRAGFAVVEPNIRGSTGFGLAFERADDRDKRGDALRDVATVNAWTRAQPFCDSRVAIMGTSYGGYMTLLALTRQPELWQAGVDASGMSDLKTMEELEDQTIRAYDETEFGVLGKDDAVLEEWSPLKDMTRIVAPVFIYQGVNDPVTPKEQADRIVRALRERQIPVEYMLLADEGHGVVRRENRVAYLARVVRFFEEHLPAK